MGRRVPAEGLLLRCLRELLAIPKMLKSPIL
jgi:hypothetical protein